MKPLEYYATLDAIDLARHPDFRSWVLHPTPEAARFWESLKAVYPDRQPVLEEARWIVAGLESTWKDISDTEVQASLTRLSEKRATRPPVVRVVRPLWYRYAAAAAVVLVAGLGGWFYSRLNAPLRYHTGFGQMLTLTLSDSTVVTLNANSTLEMAAGWQQSGRREVTLTGEAYFDVHKKPQGKRMPFVVHTGVADVVVLGTRFNVSTRRSRTRVVLQEGQVKLDLRKQPDVLMRPGDLVETGAGQTSIRRARVNPDRYVAWRENLLVLEDERLSDIFQRFSDQYGLTVTTPNQELLTERFTGTFPADRPELLLRLLAETFRLKVDQQDNHIVLTK
ncbi:FecR family protein [Larkinella soli]|uniref:FecR family protein n=1 Tax=Larkinella soli TaxID=1770527 RepID=UPI0013E2DFE9|nr:FecR domain-containing protein [Larkinella soli]